jgi:hypothetical protein
MYRNRDYEAFVQDGVGDDYDTVGNYNLFMQCDTPDKTAFCELPDRFSFRLCRRDELTVPLLFGANAKNRTKQI